MQQRCSKEQDFLMIFGQFFKSEQKILKNANQKKKTTNKQKQMK